MDNQTDDYNDTFNTSNYTYVPISSRPETYIVPAIFAVMFVVGLVGNGTVVYVYLKDKTMRSAPGALITSLAVGDLVVFLGTVPFICTIYTFESWPYGEFICKVSEFLKDLSIGVTVFTLTVLSFDRYLAIAWPLYRHRHNFTKKFTRAVILTIWGASIAISFPGAYYSYVGKSGIDHEILVCYPFPRDSFSWYPRTMIATKFVLLYALPLLIVTMFYVLMARKLMISRDTLGENDSQARLMRVRTKVAKVVLALAVVFAICFFPSHLFMLWFYFNENASEQYNICWHILRITGFVLLFANSCLNPLTLFFISGVYRNHYKRYLFWYCCPPEDDAVFNISMRASSTRTSRTFSKIAVSSKV